MKANIMQALREVYREKLHSEGLSPTRAIEATAQHAANVGLNANNVRRELRAIYLPRRRTRRCTTVQRRRDKSVIREQEPVKVQRY